MTEMEIRQWVEAVDAEVDSILGAIDQACDEPASSEADGESALYSVRRLAPESRKSIAGEERRFRRT